MISKVVNLIHALVVGTTAILKVYPESVTLKAAYFITLIKNALKDFDNNQHSDAFYNAIAWIGLKNTEAWNDPSVNQSQIDSIINNAISNETHNCPN
ncbi:hypothetical protein ACFSQ0_06405 [Mesonia sediminis]|uniref:Uncharacterized protein n=1 Tax=Mesonia sediminis TaxID=1703946 RepID=A0ABW5SEP3_9FLAO